VEAVICGRNVSLVVSDPLTIVEISDVDIIL
jgi:hypothetical protein